MNTMHIWEVYYLIEDTGLKMVTRYLHKSKAIRTLTPVDWIDKGETIGRALDVLGKPVVVERQIMFTDEQDQ